MRDASSFNSIPAMFNALAEKRKTLPLFRKRYGKELHTCTWHDAREQVQRIAAGLIRIGLEHGDRVAIMADNGLCYSFCDLAIQAIGCIVVPIYTTLAAGEIRHIITDSGSRLIIVGVEAGVPRVKEALASVETPPEWMLMRKAEACSSGDDHLLSTLMETEPGDEELRLVEERTAGLNHDDLSCIIFTSGTTGPPKGVMLSHGNLLFNVEASLHAIPLQEGDLVLSFLPMSHVFERSMGFCAALAVGATIHYARSLATVTHDFAECAPSTAMTVPRFLEKLHDRALSAIQTAKPLTRNVARAALALRMKEVKKKRLGERVPLWVNAFSRPARRVLKPIRDNLGGRLKFLVSGGAALSVDLWDFFEAVDITVIQGYGLTETSPVITVNRLDRNRPASVGLPLHNVQVRLAEDFEIEVKGPSIMKGYWNNEKATRDVFTDDGWFKTGDIGSIDRL
ncbi:MAG: AMP-binding protein, partial [Planctomycetota bacterium]